MPLLVNALFGYLVFLAVLDGRAEILILNPGNRPLVSRRIICRPRTNVDQSDPAETRASRRLVWARWNRAGFRGLAPKEGIRIVKKSWRGICIVHSKQV